MQGKIAIVTGASRGVGKGIALALGDAGATVYVTGRSVAGAETEGLVGTIDATAGEVTRRGGQGIAVRCDHTDEGDVESLFARVTTEAGRLDVLVNCAWGGYEQFDWAKFGAPFWEQPAANWERMFDAGVRAALVASRLAAPLMVAAGRGLIVHVTAWDHEKYLGNLYYDLAKSATNRMALGMSQELKSRGVAVVALAPGFVATERIVEMFAAAGRPAPESAETPEYAGRAVAALAGDGNVIAKSGRVLTVGELALEYGFTDVDGRQLPPFRMPE